MSSQLVSLIINIVTLFSYVKEIITTTSPISWPPLTSMDYITEHTDNDSIIKSVNNLSQEIIHLLMTAKSYIK